MIGVTQQVKIYLALLQGGLQLMATMPQLHNLIIISLAVFLVDLPCSWVMEFEQRVSDTLREHCIPLSVDSLVKGGMNYI